MTGIRNVWLLLVMAVTLTGTIWALNNGRARTPHMGWNVYYANSTNWNLATVKAAADALVSTGLREKGYNIVWLDAGWASCSPGQRDANGTPMAKFSLQEFVDYCHARGLKAGIYTDTGMSKGCGSCFGSGAYIQGDMDYFSSLGFDAIKIDHCGGSDNFASAQLSYNAFRDAINGRMDINVCTWGTDNVASWGATAGNSWRTGSDISYIARHIGWDYYPNNNDDTSVVHAFRRALNPAVQGPGAYNDPDYLLIGEYAAGQSFGLTVTEQKSYFTLWCMLGAPLILATNLTVVTQQTLTIIGNQELIAVDQDSLCKQGTIITSAANANLLVLKKDLQDPYVKAVTFFNNTGTTQTMSVRWAAIGLSGNQAVRDLWAHTDLGVYPDSFSASVPSHGVFAMKIGNTISTPTVALPAISSGGGVFYDSVLVSISCDTIGATIRYTTDNSDPTGTSLPYTAPFWVKNSTVVRARGFKTGVTESPVANATFTKRTPYPGTTFAVPCTIQAEYFDLGGEDAAYHDVDRTNRGNALRTTEGVDVETLAAGGYNVGFVTAGEWLEYSVNVVNAGNYTIECRVASAGNNGSFHIEFGGANKTGAITVPNTGSWGTYQMVTVSNVNVSAGPQVMRVVFDAVGSMDGGVANVDYINIKPSTAGINLFSFRNTPGVLVQAGPNPMRDRTTFTLSGAAAQVNIFDRDGRVVCTVGTTNRAPLQWDGTNVRGQNVNPGVYFYTVTMDGRQSTGRIMVLPRDGAGR